MHISTKNAAHRHVLTHARVRAHTHTHARARAGTTHCTHNTEVHRYTPANTHTPTCKHADTQTCSHTHESTTHAHLDRQTRCTSAAVEVDNCDRRSSLGSAISTTWRDHKTYRGSLSTLPHSDARRRMAKTSDRTHTGKSRFVQQITHESRCFLLMISLYRMV